MLQEFKRTHPSANKAQMESAFVAKVGARKDRAVFVGDGYSLRLSEANTDSFSNVVLSLSKLEKYDSFPMVICIVRPDRLEFRIANTTFLKRISHSSHSFRADNIRGSFLGHDIMDEYEGIPNRPEHFEHLFAIHTEYSWEENVERLVEATNAIVARSTRFDVTPEIADRVLDAPARAAAATRANEFQNAQRRLMEIVERYRGDLLQASTIDNVNIRGNTIEQIITGAVNAHRLDDLVFPLARGGRLIVDIKTKLLDRASAPKAYNIDKMLRLLAEPGTSFAFFFVGLDGTRRRAQALLVSMFDPMVLEATRIQSHWAGRASRGVTQLTGDISKIFEANYLPSVDLEAGKELLRHFLKR